MKVKELIEYLEDFDPESPVHFAYNYGDYWRSQVAPRVSRVSEGQVAYSEYHRMDKLMEDDDCYDEEPGNPEENVRRVVVID
jgi:hypothetical protein